MGEMFVYKGPAIGGGGLRSLRMKRLCEACMGGAAAEVGLFFFLEMEAGLWPGEVSVRCPRGPTLL